MGMSLDGGWMDPGCKGWPPKLHAGAPSAFVLVGLAAVRDQWATWTPALLTATECWRLECCKPRRVADVRPQRQ